MQAKLDNADDSECCMCFTTYEEDIQDQTGKEWLHVLLANGYTRTVLNFVTFALIFVLRTCKCIDVLC